MSLAWTKKLPAYQGEEPYLFFCFSDADARRAGKLAKRMFARGTRVWYSTGRPRDLSERRERELRMSGAALAVLFLSETARSDLDFKNAALYCQVRGIPLVCIDADEDVNALSFGLTGNQPHLSGRIYRKAAAMEEALIRCEGFSQELIGPDPIIPPPPIIKIAVILAALSALALVIVLFGGRLLGGILPDNDRDDTVRIEDSTFRAAVRAAQGGGPITEESLEGVETLRLKELPESAEELALLPSLTRVEIPQELAPEALWLLDEGYTVVLYGGGAK